MTLFDKDTVLVGGVVGGLAALSFLYFLGRGRSSRSDIPLVPIAVRGDAHLLTLSETSHSPAVVRE